MALTIGDALLKLGVNTKELDAGLKRAGKNIQTSTSNMQKHMKMAGVAMVGASAAIAGAFAMTVRAAAKEEKGMLRLQIATENVGIAYDEVRDSLEAWIDTMQQKTAISDTEQRDSLASLIRITRDVTEAQDLLTLAMDVAVGMGRDLEGATTLLMYALSGNWGMLERYIPAIKAAANEEEKWFMLRELFAGQAEAFGKSMAGQYQLLKHNIGDIAESIGFILLPIVQKIATAFNQFAQMVKSIPQPLIIAAVAFTALAGALMGVAGAAMLAIPGVISLGAALSGTTAVTMTFTGALVALKVALLSFLATVGVAIGLIGALVVAIAALGYSLYRIADYYIGSEKAAHGYSVEMVGLLKLHGEGAKAAILAAQSEAWFREEIEKMTDATKRNFVAMLTSIGVLHELDEAVLKLIGDEYVLAVVTDTSTKGMLEQAVAAEEAGLSKDALAAGVEDLTTKEYGLASATSMVVDTNYELLHAWNQLTTTGGVVARMYSEQTMEALRAMQASVTLRGEQHILMGMARQAIAEATGMAYGAGGWTYPAGGLPAGGLGPFVAAAIGLEWTAGGWMFPPMRFQHGGLITEPTLLYGLRSMRPYAVAGERGTEVVSPTGAGDTIINIYGPVVREDADIQRLTQTISRELEKERRTRAVQRGVQL